MALYPCRHRLKHNATAPVKQQRIRVPLQRGQRRHAVAWAAAEEEAAAAEPVEFRDELGELSEKIDALVESCDENMKGTSIFLVGMMGSGKSTVGQCLANVLKYCFFDSDKVVEQATDGKTVAQIFEESGEEGFRDIESNVLQELSAYKSLVVATGGGAVKRHQNWGALQAGITVYLDGEPELLAKRIHSQDGAASRPLLSGDDGAQSEGATAERLRDLLAERKDVYQNADCTVPLAGDSDFGAGAPEMTYRILSAIDQRIKESAKSRQQYQKVDIQYASGKENINAV